MPPSDYPAFAQLLVAAEIDSISLNSDSLLKAMAVIVIVETENAAGQPPQPRDGDGADG